MTLADSTLFYQANPDVHVILTYSDHDKLDDLVCNFLNEGLKRKQLCVYASVNLDNKIMEKLSSKIIQFEENVKNDNLLVVNLIPHFLAVMDHDIEMFELLKKSVLVKLQKRTDKHVRLHGDLVSYLFENKHYEECFFLEEWWQKNPFCGTKICPYQNSVLEGAPSEKKDKLINTHDKIVLC